MTFIKFICCSCLMLGGVFAADIEQASACGNGALIMEDKFETLDPTWGFSEEDPHRTNGQDGLTYKVEAKTGIFVLNQAGLYDDYEVCVDFKIDAPKDTYAYVGAVVWASDKDNGYEVDVFPVQGTYALYRYQKGKTLKPIQPTSSSAITKGTDTTNELSVAVSGKKGTITVNGKKVTDFTGQPPSDGSLVGLALELPEGDAGTATITVKSFQLRELESSEPKQ
jgi:hypothetical protein